MATNKSKLFLSFIASLPSSPKRQESQIQEPQLVSWGKVKVKVVQLFSIPCRVLYSPRNSPGQNTGVGSLFLLRGIFPTQGSKPRSPAMQVDSLSAETQGKPILEEVAI